jgi:predicted ATPase/DNA-binding CsgD family transcriptional regulator
MNNPDFEPLSNRELEIVHLLAEGLSNREIAQKLVLSPETIKWYNKQINAKLGVKSRTQAVSKARQIGLIGETRTPPPKTTIKHNLPAQPSSFVGRKREIDAVKQLLSLARLVTLTGPGGTGKTRLALKVAEAVAGTYADGVAFVSLASISDPDLVPNTIAHSVGVVEKSDQPLVESLGRYFKNKNALLVLDNFEHVLKSARLVANLLAAAANLVVLTTSREGLNLSGEQQYQVLPLAIPDAAGSLSDLSTNESINLFVQRARAVSPRFRLTEENAAAVTALCSHLDGLPLAIELAAARVKLFHPQQLLERLESRLQLLTGGASDLPARQRTLRNTLDWSYNLLDLDEQKLFARLAVFVGGWSLDAVEAVLTPGLQIEVIDGLESLLNKSLVYHEDSQDGDLRFLMLDTIHEYALERLSGSGEEQAIRDRHLDYFVKLAEEMEPGYWRHNQLILLKRTEVEWSNLHAAFKWAIKSRGFEDAAVLSSSLVYYFRYKDRIVEGYRWLDQVLAVKDALSPSLQVPLLLGASKLAWFFDLSRSKLFSQEALVLARELGSKYLEAWSLIELAFDRPEEYEQVARNCQQGLELFQELDDKPGMAVAHNNLGELARMAGDYGRAKEAYESSLAICRETGEIIRQNLILANLAFVAYDAGDYGRARDLGASFTLQMHEIGSLMAVSCGLAVVAGAVGKMGGPEKAARILGASSTLLAETGVDYHPTDLPEIDKYTDAVKAQLDKVAYESAWSEGQAMTLEQAIAYALTE